MAMVACKDGAPIARENSYAQLHPTLVPGRAQPCDFVFQFEFFTLETSQPDVIAGWPRHFLLYSTLQKLMLLRQFSEMSVERHHALRLR